MTFLCEFNIRQTKDWDPPGRQENKSRPNSKQTKRFGLRPRPQLEIFDILGEDQQNQVLDVPQTDEEHNSQYQEPRTESNHILVDVTEDVKVVTTARTTDASPPSPGEGASWTMLEIIKKIIQIAFSN